MSELDPETQEIIDDPVPAEAERETRLTPEGGGREDARSACPSAATASSRRLIERVNRDDQLKGWWHVANVNAAVRLEINDHSWVHIQIVANIALKLLRQLFKHGIEPAMVTDYGMSGDDAEVVVTLSALTHCIGMSVHRRRPRGLLALPRRAEAARAAATGSTRSPS